MKTNLKKEFPLLLIAAVPFIYLLAIWKNIPARVAMHYDLNGNIDRYGSKNEFFLIAFFLPVLLYLLTLLLPKIDPKGKIEKMGAKYYQFRFILLLFISALSVYIVHTGA